MTMFSVGEAVIDSALEMTLDRRPIAWLGADAELIEVHRHWLEPFFLEEGDTWSLNFRTWILRVDDKVIVVDPCTGNARPNPLPPFNMLDTPFIERFTATGNRVEDVDFVFCTHMHHDHCGWNTRLSNGRWIPTFPKARYIFLRREYERWHPDHAGKFSGMEYNAGVFERSIAPVVEAGLAELVMEDFRFSHSLSVEPGYGHTHGHAMLRLVSAGEEAIFSGDAFHHPLQLVNPAIQFGDCDSLEEAVATRQQLVKDGLAREALLIPAHLPFPHAGWVRKVDGGIVFKPREGGRSYVPD